MLGHIENQTDWAMFDCNISKMEKTLSHWDVGSYRVAHTSNPISQQFVVDENAFPVLIQLLRSHPSPNIKVYTRLLCDMVKININDFLKNNFYL